MSLKEKEIRFWKDTAGKTNGFGFTFADTFEAFEELVNWGIRRQRDNTIYTKTIDELNEEWIEKVEEVFGYDLDERRKILNKEDTLHSLREAISWILYIRDEGFSEEKTKKALESIGEIIDELEKGDE